jgi:hypothetical protein
MPEPATVLVTPPELISIDNGPTIYIIADKAYSVVKDYAQQVTDKIIKAAEEAEVKENDILNNVVMHATPLVARAGAGDQKGDYYKNRPTIDIVTVESNKTTARFDRWILASIQEQDTEKTDVIETFGDPHIFSSGRFMRRFGFQGFIRTTAPNPQANDEDMKTPGHVLFKAFYDQYMRSTVQAQEGCFTRITVGEDVYDGFINSFSINRDSQNEFVASFSFSMLCFSFTNPNSPNVLAISVAAATQSPNSSVSRPMSPAARKLADKAAANAKAVAKVNAVVNTAIAAVKTAANETASTIEAEVIPVVDSVATSGTDVATGTVGAIDNIFNTVGQGIDAGAVGFVTLISSDKNTNYTVTPEFPGFRAVNFETDLSKVYSSARNNFVISKTPSDAAKTTTQSTLRTKELLVVSTSGELESILPIKVRGSNGTKARALLRYTNNNGAQLSIISARLFSSGVQYSQVNLTDTTNNIGTVSMSYPVYLDIGYDIKTSVGTTLFSYILQNSVVNYTVKLYPALGHKQFEVKNTADVLETNVANVVPSNVIIAHDNYLQTSISINSLAPAYIEADRAVLSITPTIQINGFKSVTLNPLTIGLYKGPSSIYASFLKLNYVSKHWDALRTSSFDRFGYLTFTMNTTLTVLSDAVLSVLYASTLMLYTTGATYGGILLEPTALGNGKVKSTQLRTRVVNISISAGVITIVVEVNAVKHIGLGSVINDSSVWMALTNLTGASLIVPPETGMKSPDSWSAANV